MRSGSLRKQLKWTGTNWKLVLTNALLEEEINKKESNKWLGNKKLTNSSYQVTNLELLSCLLSAQDLQALSDHGSGAAGQYV